MERGNKKSNPGCEEQKPLEDAQGTRFEPYGELQIIAEGEHAGADEKSGNVSDSPGKQQFDHGDRA